MVWKLILMFVAGLLLGLMATRTDAATFNGDEQICRNLAGASYNVAEMRDAGVTWEMFEPWIGTQLLEAMSNPDSYIKTADDAAFVIQQFKRIFDEPKLEGIEAIDLIYKACMAVSKHKLML